MLTGSIKQHLKNAHGLGALRKVCPQAVGDAFLVLAITHVMATFQVLLDQLDHFPVTTLAYNVHPWVFINFPHSHQRPQVGLYFCPELDCLPVITLIIFPSQSWSAYVQYTPVTKLDYLHVTRLDCLSVIKFDLFIYTVYNVYSIYIYIYTYNSTVCTYTGGTHI